MVFRLSDFICRWPEAQNPSKICPSRFRDIMRLRASGLSCVSCRILCGSMRQEGALNMDLNIPYQNLQFLGATRSSLLTPLPPQRRISSRMEHTPCWASWAHVHSAKVAWLSMGLALPAAMGCSRVFVSASILEQGPEHHAAQAIFIVAAQVNSRECIITLFRPVHWVHACFVLVSAVLSSAPLVS